MALADALKIVSGGAMRSLLTETVPAFERVQRAKIDVRFALTSVLTKEIGQGVPFDVALLPRPALDALAGRGRVAAAPLTDITRSAVGLCARAGAPKPDITTVAALRRTLVQAQSLGYSDGPSGVYVTELLQRLGIAAEMKSKIRLTGAPVAELVARGEAEIGIQQIVAILAVAGAELVGPLPTELQNVIVYSAGISVHSGDPAMGRAFIAFMATPEVTRMIRGKGMEPAG